MQRRDWALAAALLATVGLAGCDRPAEPAEEVVESTGASEMEPLDPELAGRLPAGLTVEQVQQGRELFVMCAVCHGFDAEGTQLGPSLRDQEWIHASGEVGEIERVISAGVPAPEEFDIPMPALGGTYSPEQIRALAAYVATLAPTPAPAAAP